MENIYLFFVIVLFVLAISDLVVGVANDAVNFLNSAIGSKAAPFRITMIVAALGVFVGAAFSGGMMEIARSGIFHPGQFDFSDIMLIFLAVMITDVILLDTFNTLGLPTSTTVSIVFELLGASVGIAMMKIMQSDSPQPISDFINSSKALAIISGILLSVVIAFTFGALIQYLARIVFSFNYEKRFKYFGAIYGGLSVTLIVYFMLIKGVKGATFMSDESARWIMSNSGLILTASFIGFTVLLQILSLLFRLNILKFIVLFGTFALAMAFAGNDLVNFIGVPLAGYESFKTFMSVQGADPDFFKMDSLAGAIKTPTSYLLLAGLVMVITLFTSRKAKSVIKTSVDLSRQDEGEERFSSTPLSRAIVRLAVNTSSKITRFVPDSVSARIEKQFVPLPHDKNDHNAPSFDMIRASVNLVVASMLIALGTSLKLPLSTTYVTFMVAMGSSLSDRAWDRESAVYRVTGVFSVIGGWFFTALSAFVVSFVLAVLFFFGGIFAIIAMIVIAILLVIRTHKIHHKREHKNDELELEISRISDENILETCIDNVTSMLNQTQLEYKKTISGLADEDISSLRKVNKALQKMTKKAKDRKANITTIINKLREDSIESGHFYVQSLDYLREIIHSLNFIVTPVYEHVNNNHKKLNQAQISEIKKLGQDLGTFLTRIATDISDSNFNNLESIVTEQQKNIAMIDLFRKNEVKRIKKEGTSTRNSLLFMTLLQETKNLHLFALNLYKAQRDFVTFKHTLSNNKRG